MKYYKKRIGVMFLMSLWEEGAKLKSFDTLMSDINTDVLIIGGGICGLLTAYMLEQSGSNCILVEADKVCGGITKNTTAKITAQHGLVYHKLTERFGLKKAKQYLNANEEALEQYSLLCRNIDCDFKPTDSYVYSLDNREKLDKEIAALKKIGKQAELTDSLPLPFPVAGAVKFKAQAQFDPLKFAAEISKELNIYEHTRVLELVGKKAVTNGGSISANNIIVATHFPFINKHGSYFLKLYQHRSYVTALKNAEQLCGIYVDEAQNGMSFRNSGDILLIGGGGHRTGKNGGGWQELREFAKQYYPNSTEYCYWATQDCISLDGVPYIGKYSAGTDGLYVATGFNKWGMTSSMTAAMLLRDMVQQKKNKYSELFSPSRSILRPQLALNAWEAVSNILTPTSKRCPHLGCALKWNKYEHTWDCPCHGSRFTEEGKLIDNPATGDLK